MNSQDVGGRERYKRLIAAAQGESSIKCAVAHPCDDASLGGHIDVGGKHFRVGCDLLQDLLPQTLIRYGFHCLHENADLLWANRRGRCRAGKIEKCTAHTTTRLFILNDLARGAASGRWSAGQIAQPYQGWY